MHFYLKHLKLCFRNIELKFAVVVAETDAKLKVEMLIDQKVTLYKQPLYLGIPQLTLNMNDTSGIR